MASIVGKTIKGQTYYYLREVARVGGRPKIISQRYLGKATDIEAAVEGATVVPDRTRHLAFGDVAAVWSVLGRLRVAEIIDEVVGPRRADAGAPVGTYIALATLNRACDPCSKLAFSDWWAKTAADRWVHLPAGALDHRRFWEAMGAIGEAQLKEAERRIVAGMVELLRRRPLGPRARHDQLRHLDRLGQRPGADRPTGPVQAKTGRLAHRRPRLRLHRRGHPARQPRLPRQPSRRHPVPGYGPRARHTFRGLVRRCGAS